MNVPLDRMRHIVHHHAALFFMTGPIVSGIRHKSACLFGTCVIDWVQTGYGKLRFVRKGA